MEGQGCTIMRVPAANVNKPGGSVDTLVGQGALFIEAVGDILKLKLSDGTILTAKVGGVNVVFSV